MKWISLEDELPEKGKSVLTLGVCKHMYVKNDSKIENIISVGNYRGVGIWHIEADMHPTWGAPFWITTVTHWMLLPNPPND